MLKNLLFWKEVKERGQTLVEVLIAMSVVAVLALGITGAANLTMRVSHDSERKNIALGIANEEMEFVRSIAYNDIGFSSPQDDDPTGILGYNEEVSRNNQTYNISRRVEYINDPLTALADDYKKVMMLVSWLAPNNVTNQASLVTYMSEDEMCPTQPCPPGFRFERVLCECVEYNPPPPPPDCIDNGFQCTATESDCTGTGGTLRSGYGCDAGVCCQPPYLCTSQKNWNATTQTYDAYTCVDTATDCAGTTRDDYYCDAGVCCEPQKNCVGHAGGVCKDSVEACTGQGGTVYPDYTCVTEEQACCKTPPACTTVAGQYCGRNQGQCVSEGGIVKSNYSCTEEPAGDVCCAPMPSCAYECVSNNGSCTGSGGTVITTQACDEGACCQPPPRCEDQRIWEFDENGTYVPRNFSCVPTESDCLGTVISPTTYRCDTGVCCQPPRDCENNYNQCMANATDCDEDGDGNMQESFVLDASMYRCAEAGDVCCHPPRVRPTRTCGGALICDDECSTSADCQANRPNVASPCYFKELRGGGQQCGRAITSWMCVDNQWSLHCINSLGQEGQGCTNGCDWTPPTGRSGRTCVQLRCPENTSCITNWGGKMDVCRQNSAFISGGCVDQTDPDTGERECVDTSDGTCLGALCEP